MWYQTKKKSGIAFLKNKLNKVFISTCLFYINHTSFQHVENIYIIFKIKSMDEINIFGQNNKLVITFS